MTITTDQPPEEIQVPVWWKNGGILTRRDALDMEHPESTYNYIKNVLNLNPEDYGCYLFDSERYMARKNIESLYAAEAAGYINNKQLEIMVRDISEQYLDEW